MTGQVEPVRAHVRISGVVQGVNFRNWVATRARALNVLGWVRNLHDGRVEAIFEVPTAAVAEIIEASHTGPSMAQVEKVDVEYGEATGEFPDFSVRRG